MKLNADLGEGFGNWQHDSDTDIMPLIDMANIACGYHAGDAVSMQQTISLACAYGVDIGAHPSYPDMQGFGRRSMRIPREELIAMIHAQIAVLEGMAKCQNMEISYVKPHGALYNDMMRDTAIYQDVLAAMSSYHRRLPLVIQALVDMHEYTALARRSSIELIYEAFCDRRYAPSGLLLPREVQNAVLNMQDTVSQAKRLIEHNEIVTSDGSVISLNVDTICVHGDNPQALLAVQTIRSFLDEKYPV